MRQKMMAGLLLLLFALFGAPQDAYGAQEEGALAQAALVTEKESSGAIRISWEAIETGEGAADIVTYYVMRRGTKDSKGTGAWKTIAEVAAQEADAGASYTYVDTLKSKKAQQYEYKLCTLSEDGTDTREPSYEEQTDAGAVLGTNIRICIDPGHYGSLNNNYSYSGNNGKYPYSEAKFTVQVGNALKKELKEKYGIDSYMTRSGDKISLKYNGKTYSNANLDKKNIAVRGYMASENGCDFFISLHTNSTAAKKKPWDQSKKINKVFVFVNKTAHGNAGAMKIANSIGVNLTAYNKKAGIQTAGFKKRSKNAAPGFTEKKNAALNGTGTVIFRKGSTGGDYYGVLRGSSAKGVQGILVEHAFHATRIMRKKANASAKLCENWAACDAYGIAYGYGFMGKEQR